jgi:hypothetical protein
LWGKKETITEQRVRQSERITLALPIKVSGTNLFGDVFLCDGWTEVISQNGARIRLAQNLAPNQEITILCLETGKEAVARVVGRLNSKSRENAYGIMLLNPEAHPWGIDFPPRGDSAVAVGRIVLECLACHTRELAYLDGFELEVLESNESLSRFCRRCTDTTIWRKSFEPLPVPQASPESAPQNGVERRREVRREVRTVACIRSREFGEELVKVRNVSRSGLCFEGRNAYEKDWRIEVAIPYSSGGGNIFLPARIARVQLVPAGAITLFGVEYVRQQA